MYKRQGYRIDAVGEAHIDNALVDICDTTGILAQMCIRDRPRPVPFVASAAANGIQKPSRAPTRAWVATGQRKSGGSQ